MALPVANTGVNTDGTSGAGGGGNIDINALLKAAMGGGQQDPLAQGLSGIFDLWNVISGKNNKNTQQNINNYAFPNAKYVGGYADMLNAALTKPGDYKMTPGAQFAMDQGLEGVARHGNAMFGTTRSGNTAIELEKYATGFAEQNYNNYISQLTQLSQGNPLAAGLFQQGKNSGDQSIANAFAGISDLIRLATGGTSGKAVSDIMKKLGLGGGVDGGPGTPGWGSDITGPDGSNMDVGGGGGPGTPGWGSDITGPDMSIDTGISDTGGDLGSVFGDIFGGL